MSKFPPILSNWLSSIRNHQREHGNQQTVMESYVKPLYTAEDLKHLAFTNTMPGVEPYVRGTQATMYTQRPWTIRQYAGFSTAEESNAFYKESLAAGMQGLSVAFDLATHRGYDSDHPRARADVGHVGVAIDTVEDMKHLFAGISLQDVSVSMTMSGAVLPIMACFIVAAEEQGVPAHSLKGTIQNDILKEFICRNTYIYPPAASLKIVSDVVSYITKNLPNFNPISISGYHMQEAGADETVELAFTLANGREYVRHLIDSGLTVDSFAPRLSFFFGVGMNFYQEIAKLRAARLLWSRIMADFNPQNPKSSQLRMHCQTSGWSLAAEDPYNNVVRTTVEAMAAVFGGTQSLHTNAFDEAHALPSQFSARIARNTQLVLQEESGLTAVVDPWGGSYMMETLTQTIANNAWELIQSIDQNGGIIHWIDKGLAKQKIEALALKRQARIDQGEDTIIGVNKHTSPDDQNDFNLRKIDADTVRNRQIERLNTIKNQRDNSAVDAALNSLKKAAQCDGENLLHLSIQAIKARATIGEISSALEEVFGRYDINVPVNHNVYASNRRNSEWLLTKQRVQTLTRHLHRHPKLLISKLGQDGHDRGARTIASVLQDAGFEIILSPLFKTPQEVATAAIEQKVDLIGVSSLAGSHALLIAELFAALSSNQYRPIPVVVGGIIPQYDFSKLHELGVIAIFGPNVKIAAAIHSITEIILQSTAQEKERTTC